MTTIGYGDLVPLSIGGKIFASMAAVTGILVIGMPVAVISTKFYEYFEKLKKETYLITKYKMLKDPTYVKISYKDKCFNVFKKRPVLNN